MSTQQGTIFVCDGCSKSAPAEEGHLPNNWWELAINLHIFKNGGGGGVDRPIHACSEKCIRSAVSNGFDDYWTNS